MKITGLISLLSIGLFVGSGGVYAQEPIQAISPATNINPAEAELGKNYFLIRASLNQGLFPVILATI
jgi:hypothetical protein